MREALATLTGNGLDQAARAAFDDERVLIINQTEQGAGTVFLLRASDLCPHGNSSLASEDTLFRSACSDGINFWLLGPTSSICFH